MNIGNGKLRSLEPKQNPERHETDDGDPERCDEDVLYISPDAQVEPHQTVSANGIEMTEGNENQGQRNVPEVRALITIHEEDRAEKGCPGSDKRSIPYNAVEAFIFIACLFSKCKPDNESINNEEDEPSKECRISKSHRGGDANQGKCVRNPPYPFARKKLRALLREIVRRMDQERDCKVEDNDHRDVSHNIKRR